MLDKINEYEGMSLFKKGIETSGIELYPSDVKTLINSNLVTSENGTKDLTFVAINKMGKEMKYQVILTYDDTKSLILFTDETYNERIKLKIYFSQYKMNGENLELIPTLSNSDRQVGLNIIKELMKQLYTFYCIRYYD